MRTVSAAIDIDASPMKVWEVLTNLSAYPRWNPLFPEASGEIAVGSVITLTSMHSAGRRPMTVKATVLAAEPGAELRWAAGLKRVIGGEHSFSLSPTQRGTRLVQSETFGGLLVPFSGNVLLRAEASFRELNVALRNRVAAPDA